MNADEYRKMYELESNYWWHQGRRRIIERLLKKVLPSDQPSTRAVLGQPGARILDLGCGTGINFEILGKFGRVEGIDSSPEALRFCQKRGHHAVRQGDIERLDHSLGGYDLVTALDILEHVDDEKTLAEIHRVLKPGGHLFILAPAYQFLWSGHDEALHHKRRYLLSEMHRKLTQAGFKTTKRSYCITFLALPIVLYRFLTSLWPGQQPASSYVLLPGWLNRTFIKLLHLEARYLSYFNFPFGISILCIAQK